MYSNFLPTLDIYISYESEYIYILRAVRQGIAWYWIGVEVFFILFLCGCVKCMKLKVEQKKTLSSQFASSQTSPTAAAGRSPLPRSAAASFPAACSARPASATRWTASTPSSRSCTVQNETELVIKLVCLHYPVGLTLRTYHGRFASARRP